jgi:hypothetical protein
MTTLDLGQWCILQTAGADTLRVVEALTEEGLCVWAPVRWATARKPITRSRYDKPHPIMAGYVFGDAGHVGDFLHLSSIRRRDIPHFWFLEGEVVGSTPLIADSELDGLRRAEARLRAMFDAEKRKEAKPPTFDPGTKVRMEEGAYAGLSGVVEQMHGKGEAVVFIPEYNRAIKVASFLLLESVAQDGLPLNRAA